MNLKFLLLLAIIGAGVYYYYTQNPDAFGGAGNAAESTIKSDVSKTESKARNLR